MSWPNMIYFEYDIPLFVPLIFDMFICSYTFVLMKLYFYPDDIGIINLV